MSELRANSTFLFIEFNPDLVVEAADLANYRQQLETLVAQHGGQSFTNIASETTPQTVCIIFPAPLAALQTVLEARYRLHAGNERGGTTGSLGRAKLFRASIYTGPAQVQNSYYYGPTLNRAARLLAVAHYGQMLLSASTREVVQNELPEGVSLRDLGQHRLRNLVRGEQIYQMVMLDQPGEFPPLRSLDVPHSNLPVESSSFVGREEELAKLRGWLAEPAVRLLTISGPGGTGKTRLALQLANSVLNKFTNGVFFVDLSSLLDAEMAVPGICQALGVRESTDGQEQSLLKNLKNFLREQQLLLVIDGVGRTGYVSDLLRDLFTEAPGLKALVTAPDSLDLKGERAFPTPPLKLPTPDDVSSLTLEELEQYDAIKLFIERARVANPNFSLTRGNAPALVELLNLLHGVPLAIELAALRSDMLLQPTALAALIKTLQKESGGEVRPSQQNLQSTLDWTYNLLEADEKKLFVRLSVFMGGCTAEGAEAVCNATGDLWLGVGERLTLLVQKGLLREKEVEEATEESWQRRYLMLDTVRDYAINRLSLRQDVNELRDAHARYYTKLALTAAEKLVGPELTGWLARLDNEQDNCRAALNWLSDKDHLSSERLGLGLQLAGGLGRFWYLRGNLTEGRERLRYAMQLAQATALRDTALYANALNSYSTLARFQGDYATARASAEQSLALYRRLADSEGIAKSLDNLGMILYRLSDYQASRVRLEESLGLFQTQNNPAGMSSVLSTLGMIAKAKGNLEQAEDFLQRSLKLRRQVGDKQDISLSLNNLGLLANERGDFARARGYLEESLALKRELNDKYGLAVAMNNLAIVAYMEGDQIAAGRYFDESLEIKRELGDQHGVAISLLNIGVMAYAASSFVLARRCIEESLNLMRRMGDKRGTVTSLVYLGIVMVRMDDVIVAESTLRESISLSYEVNSLTAIIDSLEALAILAVARQQYKRAARLLGAAQRRRTATGVAFNNIQLKDYERTSQEARQHLGDQPYESLFNEGTNLPADQLLSYALNT